jgi:hypothetical protein
MPRPLHLGLVLWERRGPTIGYTAGDPDVTIIPSHDRGHVPDATIRLVLGLLVLYPMFDFAYHCLCFNCIGRYIRIADGTASQNDIDTIRGLLRRNRIQKAFLLAVVGVLRALQMGDDAERLARMLPGRELGRGEIRRPGRRGGGDGGGGEGRGGRRRESAGEPPDERPRQDV